MSATFPFHTQELTAPRIGVAILQSDETLEQDFRRLIPDSVELLISRVADGGNVTPEMLAEQEHLLPAAAARFPPGAHFDAFAYACTSGAAQIGAAAVAAHIRAGLPHLPESVITNPVAALIAACRAGGWTRLGLLSPYVPPVSERLRQALAAEGIETRVFGSFEVEKESQVARITGASITDAATRIAASKEIEGLFLSCTNLRTLDVIPQLEDTLGIPVMSSNQVLAWHLLRIAGVATEDGPGRLFAMPA